tara:strand:+ start:534 stop:956 length:423 start_codon:yes stop_codon:yes gene_type:complete
VVGPIQQGRELPECRLPSAVKPGRGCSWHPQTIERYYEKKNIKRYCYNEESCDGHCIHNILFVLCSDFVKPFKSSVMTKKEIVEKLNKEYPKLLKNINNKKISQKDKKKLAMEFTKFLEELADNTPNEKQFNTNKKGMKR